MQKRTILISGAGSGIGRAIAADLSADGHTSLVLVGRNRAKLEDTRRALPAGAEHFVVDADARDGTSLREAFRELRLGERNLSAVVANAGVGGENEYGPRDRWDEVLSTNLTGTYVFVNEALPYLRQSRVEYRHIVVTASILARLGVPRYSAYCASKAGLLGLVRSWASEWAAEKILVNAICPGWVETDMAELGLRQMAEGTGRSLEEIRAAQMRAVPLGKMSQPAEIAALVHFLVSGRQTSITGQALDINNGALMP